MAVLNQVLAAFASLKYMPDQNRMAAYVGAMQPKLASASSSELAISLKSLARLHFLPTRAWLADWVAAARRCVKLCKCVWEREGERDCSCGCMCVCVWVWVWLWV